eukprot:NODE_25_length_35605_cov_0.353461.p9 type:complete len:334 gc:universal NODE_25_length_35605_cov_0.353461:2733-3734(+)
MVKILYATTILDCHNYLEHFKSDKFISLDVEGTQTGKIELVQIGNATTALLIPVWKYGIPLGLNLLLRSMNTVKLVWGGSESKEFQEIGGKLFSVIDCQQLSSANNGSKGLANASLEFLNGKLERYRKLEGFSHTKFKNWATDNLPNFAIKYAAYDVFSVYYIFKVLQTAPLARPLLDSNRLFPMILAANNGRNCMSLFKSSMNIIKGEINEISKLIFCAKAIISVALHCDQLISFKRHPSFTLTTITDVSDCIQFLISTCLKVESNQIARVSVGNYTWGLQPITIKKHVENGETVKMKLLDLPIDVSALKFENWDFELSALAIGRIHARKDS